MKIYVAADFARRLEMQDVHAQLREADIEPTSSWIDLPPEYSDDGLGGELLTEPAELARHVARRDFADILAADVFLQYTTGLHSRGGRQVELGFALALAHPVMVVGPREHAFHYHVGVLVQPSLAEVIDTCHSFSLNPAAL